RFLNRDRSGRQVEYLSYTTGRTERDKSMVPSMTRLLSRVTGRQVEEQDLDRLAQQSLAETPSVDALFAPTAPAQRTVGDYEILAELGRGGMGVVYLARQLSLGRLVAMKMLPASLAGDEVALARFRREMRALGRCEHPHIVKVLASGVLPDGQIYYAMEYVPGADLEMVWRELSGRKRQGEASTLTGRALTEAVLTASRKQRDEVRRHSEPGRAAGKRSEDSGAALPLSEAPGDSLEPAFGFTTEPPIPTLPLPPLPSLPAADQDAGGYMRRVAQLIRDAAMAVQAVHDQSIVHRDIKPANLMLTPDGSRVVLMDFGLAKGQSLALTKTSSGEFLGTLRYAAPEQLAAAKVKVDYRVDVRALGATLWELLTRQQAFGEAEDQSQLAAWVLSRDLPQLRIIDPTIDRDLEAIVARAVERDPERRIQTARELAEYLDLYLSGKPVPIRTPGSVVGCAIIDLWWPLPPRPAWWWC
ncbi:MAG: serine/threonine protein kinase, partial [Planctomycetes bacterium]|nr:serine/threonine protein kinase [Planctomycetota bacterium]